MSSDIKAGDIVRLKSGGPAMTVSDVIRKFGVNPSTNPMGFKCLWFDGNEIKYRTFPPVSLMKLPKVSLQAPTADAATTESKPQV